MPLRLQVSKGFCTCERMGGRWTPEICELCSMVLRMMLPHHCPHPEAGPTDERARMCPVRACAAVGRLRVRKCAADAGELSGSGRTHPIRSIERQRATSARPSAWPRRLTASRDGPHCWPFRDFLQVLKAPCTLARYVMRKIRTLSRVLQSSRVLGSKFMICLGLVQL